MPFGTVHRPTGPNHDRPDDGNLNNNRKSFMNFAVKARSATLLRRRQAGNPLIQLDALQIQPPDLSIVTMQDLATAFEQSTQLLPSPLPPPSTAPALSYRSQTPQRPPSLPEHQPLPAMPHPPLHQPRLPEDDLELERLLTTDSDTAGLIAHAAPISRPFQEVDNTRQPPAPTKPVPLRPIYQPAPIQDDLNRRHSPSLKTLCVKLVLATIHTIQMAARRVINVQNINVSLFLLQHIDTPPLHSHSQQHAPHPPLYHDSPAPAFTLDRRLSAPVPSHATHFPSRTHSHSSFSSSSLSFDPVPLVGKSCGIFTPENHVRKLLAKWLAWRWTETFAMILLVLHGLILLIVGQTSTPTTQPPSSFGESWDQYALLAIFAFHTCFLIARILVFGLVWHKKSDSGPLPFLRHSWNRIDFISVVAYWLDFALLLTQQEIVDDTRRILVFKTLAALVLLRLLNITKGNTVILHSLKKATPLLSNVAFFVLFFVVIFAVIGVQSFKGSFLRHCVWQDPTNATNIQILDQYCGSYLDASGQKQPFIKLDGEPSDWSKGFTCEVGLQCKETANPYDNTLSMDNIFGSMMVVLIIAGNQSWTDLMYLMMDAEYFLACVYFIVIVVVMNYWLVNLFVAVINEMFAKVREDSQHSAFTMSKAAPSLADADGGTWSFKEKSNAKKTGAPLLIRLVHACKPLWVALVVVDIVFLALKNNDMTADQIQLLDYIEFVFSMVFLAEITVRYLAHWQQLDVFFKNKANRADMIIAFMTCIIWIPPIRNNQVAFAWLSGFQVLRIYRVILAIPRLRILIARVLGSVYGLLNLIFFIFMSTLICGILAFELLQGSLQQATDTMQFFSVYNSFVALNQLFSGENWTTVLYNVMQFGAPTGNAAINALFLCLWFAFSNFVMVNMFIAILMENFETAEDEKRQQQVHQFSNSVNHTVHDNTEAMVSRWNLYRYLVPTPVVATAHEIPANLVLKLPKNELRSFLKEWQPDENRRAKYQEKQHQHRQQLKQRQARQRKFGPLYTVGRFMHEQLTRLNQASLVQSSATLLNSSGTAAGSSQAFRYYPTGASSVSQQEAMVSVFGTQQTTFDQLHTFYDTSKNVKIDSSADDDRSTSLRYLLAPSLRVNIAASVEEVVLQDLEERRAMHRDFLRAHPTYDRSLFLFHPPHRLRFWCQRLIPPSHGERTFGTAPSFWGKTLFLTLITLCVLTNVVLTIYTNPVFQLEHQHDTSIPTKLAYADWAFTWIFTFEFLIKIVADGFLLTPNAYMLNGWNVLDVFVLVTLYLSNFGHFAASTGLARVFRAFKALRALRLINLLRPAKQIFTVVLIHGFSLILDAGILGMGLIIPFALYGKAIFMGLFYTCNDNAILTKATCVTEAWQPTTAPLADTMSIYAPRVWSNPYVYSFDSFWSSLLILFEIASGEGWINVLETSMSIVGKDQANQQDASQYWGIFFMVYNLAGSIFVISLFLGIILENFARRSGTAYLTLDQRRWLDLRKLLSSIRPAKRPKQVPTHGFRKLCFKLVEDKRGVFYKILTGVILFNIILLCTDYYGADDLAWLTIFKDTLYLVLVLFYWMELAIKWLGLGWTAFRQSRWHLFDLVVTLGATVSILFNIAADRHHVNVESQKLFFTALCFKLVQRNDSLHQLFTTMAASSYQIINVYAVWLVVMLTYSIMFMEIFGLTKYGPVATTEHVNFRSFSNTFVSLIRFSNGEGWNEAMHDFAVEAPNCVTAENYLDSDCGSQTWAYFLFLSFNVISMYIFTAIFVAVVADNFSYVHQVASNFSLVNRDEIRKFKKCWATFDKDRTGFLKRRDYLSFWQKLQGTFAVQVYDDMFSYKNLVRMCSVPPRADDDPLYPVRVNLQQLGLYLNHLDGKVIHQRKKDLNMIYWETALTETEQGIAFNDMLLMLAQQKLIVPENALLLDELLFNQKKKEAIQTLISIDRVKGMIETIALRKKFLRHLKAKRKEQGTPTSQQRWPDVKSTMDSPPLSPFGDEPPLLPGLSLLELDTNAQETSNGATQASIWKSMLDQEVQKK
ncbi:hypothetical protein DM01DRAFT_1332475 [Hesseltinella vesiculosa]|uniref:Calcium-channel protein CCH1 n=1 Tax=Hesseltinella vesiculosa TaxID=101127 RepID=A0A1X2GS38_9FUNG|nr:hypothetical protein DM01DRAFT_1332475 [Hesseltinella vesiculosa]